MDAMFVESEIDYISRKKTDREAASEKVTLKTNITENL